MRTLPSIEFCQEPLPEFAKLEAEWRQLEAIARPSFFNSWYWIGTLVTTLPEASRLTLLRGSVYGETVALALLGKHLLRRRHGFIRSRAFYLNEAGDPEFNLNTEHNGLLVAPLHQHRASDALLKWFAEHGNEADELYIDGVTHPFPEQIAARCGLVLSNVAVPSYWLDLGQLATSDGKLDAILSSNARQQLRRAIRHFETFGQIRLEQAVTGGDADKFFAELKNLHIATWESRGKHHSFAAPFFEVFHRRLINRHFGDGVIQLLKASAGARVIGYLYNFRLYGHIYAYQSGFAYGDKALRPGVVTHAFAIREAYRSGAHTYDFLAGGNRLKRSFSTHSTPMLWQVIQQRHLVFTAERLARSVSRRFTSHFGRSDQIISRAMES
jgi:CelD/BcsL family acetyltransferase involved in cellulose biosynthesis